MDKFYKGAVLFGVGGLVYNLIEILSRGYSHLTMFLLGGICFLAIGGINEFISWDMPFPLQMFIGGTVITFLEFVTGCIVNLWLGWNVWDYSSEWLNVMGQICPKYTLFWVLLSAVAIVLDDALRYLIDGEEMPYYRWWF